MSRAGLIWPAHHRPGPSGLGALASQPVQLEPPLPYNYMRRGWGVGGGDQLATVKLPGLTVHCTMLLDAHISDCSVEHNLNEV